MKRNSLLKTIGLCLILLFGLVLGCTKEEQNPTQGSTSPNTIVTALTATPDSVAVGNTSIISATVITNGQIDSGEVVSFSASSGSFSQRADTSDANGLVSTIYTGITSGNVYISAATSDSISIISIRVYSPSTGEGALSIQVDPTVLPANGDTTSQVTVTVNGSNGNPVPNGTIVRLAAGEKFNDVDGDGYYNKNIDQLVYDSNNDGVWNPIGDIPMTATTTSGVATATYTAGYRAGMVYVKATTGSPDDPVSDDATILLIPTSVDTVYSIALEPASPTVQVRGTGGIEFVQMTATCYDDNGNRVIEGWPITFYILNGPGGGENINGITDSVTVTTNSSGIAQVTVNSGTVSGTINLIARYGNVISNSTRITVCAGPPAFISMGVDPLNIRGFDVVGVEAEVGAVVVDIYSNYVPNGTAVYFSTSEGMITPSDVTDEGRVEATYVSAPVQQSDSGKVWIYAETAGGTVKDSCFLYVTAQPAYTFITIWPSVIAADPNQDARIQVRVYDVNMNPVVEGFEVWLSATHGALSPEEGETEGSGTMTNIFESKYTSASLDEDYSYTIPDNGIGAIDVLGAVAATGIADFKNITMTTGNSYYENCGISSLSTVYYGKPGVFFVGIKDRVGNPLGGHRIDVRIDTIAATLTSPSTAFTDKYGQAPFTFTAKADTSITNIVVEAYDSVDVRGLGEYAPLYEAIPISKLGG